MVALRWRHTSWVALLLCVTLLLPGCQMSAIGQGETADEVPSERVLTLWHSLPADQAGVLQAIADEWSSRQDADVRIELEGSPDEEALHRKLIAAIQSNIPPTLAFVRPPDIAAYVDADALVPLDSLASEVFSDTNGTKDYFTHFFDSVRYPKANNALYAWPVHRYQTLLFVNQTRMTEVGGDFPLTSWNELVRLCQLHLEQDGESCMAAFPTGTTAVLWIWNHGGDVVDETGKEPAFQGSSGHSVMEWLAALRALDGVYTVPTYDAKVEAFVDGQTLFTFESTEAIPFYETRIDSVFDLAIVPPPTSKGQAVTLATGGNIAVFRGHADEQAFALDFLQFLTSADVNYRWADMLKAYPVRRSALEKLEAQWSESSPLRQASKWLTQCRSAPLIEQWSMIEQVLAEAMVATINGSKTPEEALQEASRRTQGLLEP